jgi:hypothetical protein
VGGENTTKNDKRFKERKEKSCLSTSGVRMFRTKRMTARRGAEKAEPEY